MSIKKSLAWLLVGTVAGFGMTLAATSAVAQTAADVDPFVGGTDDDGADLFGETSNPYELIHRAILAPTMSTEQFQEQQNRAINSEAEDFRLRQQEALRQQQTTDVDAVEEISVDGEEI